jgi:ATP-dependent Clp protease protease subunit
MSNLFNPHNAQASKEIQEQMQRLGLAAPPMLNQRRWREYDETVALTTDDLLLQERIIFIGKPIDNIVAHQTIMLMLYLQSEDSTRDISLYLNSPGGMISAGMAIYDTMQYLKPDVSTVCIGMAMSMGSFLLAAGAKGKRYCLPHSTILIHQPLISGTMEGQASDLEIEAQEIIRVRRMLNELLAKHTGQPLERIEVDTDRDHYFTAEQAVEYGLVDEILTKE